MLRISFQIAMYDLNKRAHAQIMKKINRDVMVRHQYERLMRHFEPEAYSDYGYNPRTSKYEQRKARNVISRANAGKPNTYSGALRRAVQKNVKITATQYKGSLQTRGTSRHRLTNWQRDEIERVSPRERELEDKRMAREYKRLATSERYARKRKRRTKA